MRSLSDLDMVRVWEWGEARHPVDRALGLLRTALPEWSADDLAALPLGRRDGLLLRCVLSADVEGAAVPTAALSDELLAAIAARVADEDPQAATRFEVACPTCGHAWTTDLDVVAYLWEELSVHVKRVSLEVQALAHAYGWSEAEILSLSQKRRRHYLDMLA